MHVKWGDDVIIIIGLQRWLAVTQYYVHCVLRDARDPSVPYHSIRPPHWLVKRQTDGFRDSNSYPVPGSRTTRSAKVATPGEVAARCGGSGHWAGPV